MPLEIGQSIHHDRYRIDSLLGQGGMGAVYKAYDSSLEMDVAIKENLETSPQAQKQFGREANILAHLSHPNLPRVTDYFFVPNQGQYLVMDYVSGEDLHSMTQRLGRLPEPQVLSWIGQITDALAYLHGQNPPIIHRDIKPSNIRIRSDGRAMLVDFGLAKIYDVKLATTIGAQAVTPGFSPPEQYGGGNTDTRSDIYALGATLFHLLTGQSPPESVLRAINAALMPSPHQVNPEISPQMDQIIMKAVELPTERRYQNINELSTALQRSKPLPRTPSGAEGIESTVDELATHDLNQAAAPSSLAAALAAASVASSSQLNMAPAGSAPSQARVDAASLTADKSPSARKFPVWFLIAGGVLLCLVLLVAGMGIFLQGAGRNEQAAASSQTALAALATAAIVEQAAVLPTSIPQSTVTQTPPSPTVPASTETVSGPPAAYSMVAALIPPEGQVLRAVEAKDDFAYALAKSGRLYVYDLGNLAPGGEFVQLDAPSSELSLLNGNGLLRSGDYLYAFGNAGIQVLDISDASQPTLITQHKDLMVYNLTQSEDYLVAVGEGLIIVYDISTPNSPRVLGKLGTGQAKNFAAVVYENYLYVSEYSVQGNKVRSVLEVYDFSDPARLKEIQRIDAGELAFHLKILDGVLLRCNTNDVEAWELSVKDNPRFESAENAEARACAVDQGNILTNGNVLSLTNGTLLPLQSFDAQAEAGSLPARALEQTENFPYGSAVSPDYVFLTQSGRIIVLAGE